MRTVIIAYCEIQQLILQVAKWVGDLFNDGVYHTNIHLKKIPFLDEKPPDQLDRSDQCE